tara:strand:+ start:126 stop:368 length:243 start_codon:yes stop_codon:yes gene_type:complete
MMSDDMVPTKEPCPECGKKEVTKSWAGVTPGIGVDSTLTPDSKTGGDWSEMMGRIKKGLPKKYRAGIDKATTMSGRRWKG